MSTLAHGLRLHNGAIGVGVAPEGGGALTCFEYRTARGRVDILRPATIPEPGRRFALSASCFPLIPYGGRLRNGAFKYEGRHYQFGLNAPPERHSSHGDGWTREWHLDEMDDHRVRLSLPTDPGLPLQYEATQLIEISGNRLLITLSARNTGPHSIPMGLGLHPYFANRALAVVKAQAPNRREWDSELMPVRRSSNPLSAKLSRGMRASALPVSIELEDWNGQATFEWAAMDLRVRLDTIPALKHVVMWAPLHEDFFCFEPVSHATDAFNEVDPASAAITAIPPGGVRQQRFELWVDSITRAES